MQQEKTRQEHEDLIWKSVQNSVFKTGIKRWALDNKRTLLLKLIYNLFEIKYKQIQTEWTAAVFAGNMAAIDKAKSVNGDVSLLKEAVEIFNNSNK